MIYNEINIERRCGMKRKNGLLVRLKTGKATAHKRGNSNTKGKVCPKAKYKYFDYNVFHYRDIAYRGRYYTYFREKLVSFSCAVKGDNFNASSINNTKELAVFVVRKKYHSIAWREGYPLVWRVGFRSLSHGFSKLSYSL